MSERPTRDGVAASEGRDSDPSRVQQIIEHERVADEAEQTAEFHRWEAARKIVEELAGGKSKSQLSREIGKSRPHIVYAEAVWRCHLGDSPEDRPRWNVAYQAAKGSSGAPKPQSGEAATPEARNAPESNADGPPGDYRDESPWDEGEAVEGNPGTKERAPESPDTEAARLYQEIEKRVQRIRDVEANSDAMLNMIELLRDYLDRWEKHVRQR